jgi:hypothetical protein
MTTGPPVDQACRDAFDLEVAAASPGAAFDREPERDEFAREFGAVCGAELAAIATIRPSFRTAPCSKT